MPKALKTYFSWSSGKDASLALHRLQQDPGYDIDLLITSVNSYHNRVSMHGLRRELLEKQVQETGLPLSTIELPEEPSMEVYNQEMEKTLGRLQAEGYRQAGFGDIFLEDLRSYREKQVQAFGIDCVFPLWKKDTRELMHEWIDLGFKAIVLCIKSELLNESFVGREMDHQFLKDLPAGVDPCGENGEFHTFCFDGPVFAHPVEFEIGEKIFREYKAPKGSQSKEAQKGMGFWFLDLLPRVNVR